MLNEERFGGPLFSMSAGNIGSRKLNYTNKSEVNHLSNFTKKKINRVVGSSGERTPLKPSTRLIIGKQILYGLI
jgi:hypothetical protein